MLIEKKRDFDTIIAEKSNGIYAFPRKPSENFKIREIIDYCKKQNIETAEISKKELSMFKK